MPQSHVATLVRLALKGNVNVEHVIAVSEQHLELIVMPKTTNANAQRPLILAAEPLTHALVVFANVEAMLLVAFLVSCVVLALVNVEQHHLVRVWLLVHIVMLQTTFVSVLPPWLLAVERQTPVIVGRANVGRLQPVAIQGRHVNLEHANAEQHQLA